MADLDGQRTLISGGFDGKVYRWPLAENGILGKRTVAAVCKHVAFSKVPHVAPHAVDWDGDGDLDLLVGARNGEVFLLSNDGRGKFTQPIALGVKKRGGDAGPHAVDWDGDGDLDLIVGGDFGQVDLFENKGTRKQPKLAPCVPLISSKRIVSPLCKKNEMCSRRAKPWAVDWNNDGRLDLLIGDVHDHRTPKAQSTDLLTGFVWLYLRKR